MQTNIFGALTKQIFICYFLDQFALIMDNCNDRNQASKTVEYSLFSINAYSYTLIAFRF